MFSRARSVRPFAAAALAVAATLTIALANPDSTTSSTPPTPSTPQATPDMPKAPPAPTGLPVPDGAVVNKQELPGGLIIEDIKIGDGYEVKPGGIVVAHYHGTLKADPTKVFDSSFQRGEPIAFPLTGVIKGWQDGVPGMKVGGVRRLIIPAALAYGDQSPSPDLPANSDLVFIIQLVNALQVTDVSVGSGEEATTPCLTATVHTLKNEKGEVVEQSTKEHPYIWFPGEIGDARSGLDPMQAAFAGMKVGGKRKIVIPKEMSTTPPVLQTKRPSGEALTIELELVSVRNLPRQGR